MTQEEMKLLLKDLCARLPYGVIIHLVEPNEDEELYCLNIPQEGLYTRSLEHNNVTTLSPIEDIKPYLRPMSSMTEEEKQELERLINEKLNRNTDQEDDEWTPWVLHDTTGIRNSVGGERFYFDEMSFIYDWLNAHHFDYRGLIEKGLALEAPENMYNLKNK